MNLNQRLIETLRLCQVALNTAPRFGIPSASRENDDSYKIASKVDKVLREVDGEEPRVVVTTICPALPNIAYLNGSHGEGLEINLDTGEVTPPYEWQPEGEDVKFALHKVDLVELTMAYGPTHPRRGFNYDILEIAGWDGTGRWGEAEQHWRDGWTNEQKGNDDPVAEYYLTTGRAEVADYTKQMKEQQR